MSGISGVGGYGAFAARLAAQRAKTTSTATQGTSTVSGEKSFQLPSGASAPSAPNAGSAVDKALAPVHGSQAAADHAVIDLASGQNVNIPGTMVELEKADIALKYTVQLRNRALSAYEELMRMQV